MNKTAFYIFRHGETFVTKEKRLWYGFKIFSAPILNEGKPVLRKMGQYLMQVPSEYNASSQIRRCRQTVEIMTEITGKKFVFDKRLNELFIEAPWFFRNRVKSFLAEVQSKNYERSSTSYKRVMICSHAAVIDLLVYFLTGKMIGFPPPGVLLIIKKGKLTKMDFNLTSSSDPIQEIV